MSTTKIKDALGKLDTSNDNHWTTTGQPRLETLRMLAGNPALSREEVDAASPGYTRTTTAAATPAPAGAETPAQTAPVAAATAVDTTPAQTVLTVAEEPAPVAHTAAVVEAGEDTGEASLETQIAAMEHYVSRMTQSRDDASNSIVRAQAALDGLLGQRVEASIPDHLANQTAIGQYLAGQKSRLEQRSGILHDMAGAPKQSGGKAPIDKVFETRKRAIPLLNK